MPEAIRFHFDPVCPWCWITASWVRRLEELGALQASWAVFSLEIANRDSAEAARKGHARSGLALRTVIAVREGHGSSAVGRFYAALGTRVHERGEPLEAHATVIGALGDAGLDPALARGADGDDRLWQAVVAEHSALVERTRSFGVPTIVLDGGTGPAIFGPVIGRLPTDDDALELWRHVAWLARYESFSELKRDRSVVPRHLASWT
jgi:protein-disulfide isomerase-like protein with CxxC motif